MLEDLQKIADAMHQATASGDPEAAHSAADDLLVALILWLLAAHIDAEVQAMVQSILSDYEDVEKWYA